MTQSTIIHSISPEDLKEIIREVISEEQSTGKSAEAFPDLLTSKEARQKLRISEPTQLRLERRGELPSVRIGSKKFFHREQVMNFLKAKSK